ncbi:rhomboid family intramembrane serine protease [Cyanobacteria bacterium FACHB-63]|nr:rhomboid family intramembrane serine protease [Cyanobacteria bacterium FACHB-63]
MASVFMPIPALLLANLKFLFGWYAIAWILTLIDVEFWHKPPGKGLPVSEAWSFSGLIGIFLAPFIHVNWRHLKGNTIPFFVLGGLVLLRQPIDFIVITIVIALVSGILGWFLGGIAGFTPQGWLINARSTGMSDLIFGYAGFLLALFYFDRTIASAIALGLTILLFGNRLWLMLPGKIVRRMRIAWDAHLIGFIVGAFVAAYLPSLRPVSIALLQALSVPTQFPGIMIAGTVIDERFYRQTLPPLIARYVPPLLSRLRILFQLVAAAWIIAFVDFQILRGALRFNLGIRPWTLRGLIGIPLAPFLHGNWNHISGNTLGFLIFGGLLVLVKPNDFVLISIAIALISGALIWFSAFPVRFGYVGASAVIFGYIGFLLSLFYFENNLTASLLLGGTLLLIILFDRIWLGVRFREMILLRKRSLIKGILPKTFDNSWAHFLGFIAGVIVAGYLPDLRSYAAYLASLFNLSR